MRILIILLLMPFVAFANEQKLVKQFFGPDGVKNKEDVYIGEMLTHYMDEPTLGEDLPKGIEISMRLLEKAPMREIYAVLLSKDGRSQDWYIYLVNDQNKWKISAVRTLALPGLFFMALQEVESKSSRTDEEEYRYQNMLLTSKADSELKDFLHKNIDRLNSIAFEAAANLDKTKKIARSLYLNTVQYEAESGIVDVNIGGMLDNSVGYFYVPKNAVVPRMTDDNYIYIERVVGDWYLYKTT